jgi:hypothetical protein
MKIMSERNASYSERVCREDIPQRIGELIRCPITVTSVKVIFPTYA